MNWLIGEGELAEAYQNAFCDELKKYPSARGALDFINMYDGCCFQ